MNRSRHLGVLAILVLLPLLACEPGRPREAQAPRKPSPPNIVIFLADDLGWGDVGYHGSEIPTPAIDALAARGVRLERFYATPKCTPTRTRLMTGRWAIRYDLVYNLKPWRSAGFPASLPTLPGILRRHGYRTALVGKWHLGDAPGARPMDRGFDWHYGNLGGVIDHWRHRRKNGDLDWWRGTKLVEEPGFSANLLAREAVRWLGEERDKPFFLYNAFTVPHTPLEAPDEMLAVCGHIRDPKRRAYAGMVVAFDRAVSRVIETLRDDGRLDDTIIVLLGDNGASPRHGGNTGPFRGHKESVYEGGLRVPAVISWPGHLPEGTRTDQLLTITDLPPTLLAAAGVETDAEFDGRNLWAELSTGKVVPREPLYFAVEDNERVHLAVLDDPLKLILVWSKKARAPEERHLYDVLADRGERHDLWSERPEDVSRLLRLLGTWWQLHPRAAELIPQETFQTGT